ncbi:hypothetical protein ASF36_22055 [Methylobacterium sp. Leaf90]|nr:hypothetical protein ASF36_22055 [Methylobacterium sp. Leaf90]
MAFLNALGRVSRRGQWRLRRSFRAADPTGRLDLSDDGLIDFSRASDLVLTVSPRPPVGGSRCQAEPVLTVSMRAGTLFVLNPGFVEALFPDGWSAEIPPGLYDVRLMVTIGPETAEIFDEPVELI